MVICRFCPCLVYCLNLLSHCFGRYSAFPYRFFSSITATVLADTISGLFYYDHRRDDFVGGLGFKSTGAGSMGYFGKTFRYRVTSLLLVEADVAVGSAFVSKIKVSYRGIK